MKTVTLFMALSASTLVGLIAGSASASILTSGNIVVLQAGDGGSIANNAPFSVLELTKAPGQASPVQSFDISGMATNPLYTSASASSTGYLSLSQDRSSVQFNAHTIRAAIGTNENTITTRGVGSINAGGSYSLIGSYTGASGNQARSAGLMSSGDLFIGDQSGLYASGASLPSITANVRNIHSFGGTPFAFQASTTAAALSSITGGPAAPTLTALPGIGALGTTIQDFYMVSSGNDGTFDLLYISSTTGVSKFQLLGGTWTARGAATVAGGFFGIAAELDAAGGVDLYLTTGSGAGNGNSVKKFIDSALPSANITLDAGTTLFTAATGYTIKGIEFSPVPTPGACMLLTMGGALVARRRR
jgi:hypothetical protein